MQYSNIFYVPIYTDVSIYTEIYSNKWDNSISSEILMTDEPYQSKEW